MGTIEIPKSPPDRISLCGRYAYWFGTGWTVLVGVRQ